MKEIFIESKPSEPVICEEILDLQKRFRPGKDLIVTDIDTLKSLILKDETQWLETIKEQILSSTIIVKGLGRVAIVKCG